MCVCVCVQQCMYGANVIIVEGIMTFIRKDLLQVSAWLRYIVYMYIYF